MRIASRKGGRLFAILAIAAATLCAPLAQAERAGPAQDSPENTVKRLYRDYAWQAIGSTAFDHHVTYLLHQGMPALEKYFEPGLANLIRKGDECEEKTRDICGLDFDYIFNSQDDAAADLKISAMNARNVVQVEFYQPLARQSMRLDYKMVQTAKGWRISDIQYGNSEGGLRDSLLHVFELLKYDPNTPLEKPDELPQDFPDTPKGAVQRVYRDYAWQAIGLRPFAPGMHSLEDEAQPELETYFEPGLAALIRANQGCTERSGKKCVLNESIIFNSSNPNAVDMSISEPDHWARVVVSFKYRDLDRLFRLRYDTVKTSNGWRISDIDYPDMKHSLRARLKP